MRAQAVVDDVAAYPIRALSIWLTAGTNYEFRTTNLVAGIPVPGAPVTVADTILSLRNPSGTAPADALNGADGCLPVGGGTFSWEPSCFSHVATYTGYHTLYLYAYTETNYGTATVQYRTLPAGGWTTVGVSYSFGGSRAPLNALTGAGRARFETTFRPGNVSGHTILVARTGNEWNTRYAASGNSGRIAGNAQFDADLTATGFAPGDWWLYFGATVSGQTGDTRLVRNDFFVAGADLDQDGLSLALESDETGGPRVGSCDRPSQTLSNGFSCRNVGARTHPECVVTGDNIAMDAECADSLRDTDHDGLRDDLEVYGANNALMRLPRFGANPARMDVFIELDATDQNPATPMPACDGFVASGVAGTPGLFSELGQDTSGSAPMNFMTAFQVWYSSAPSWINPNGTTGISLHVDAGIADPANPRNTAYGAWGGGNSCASATCTPPEMYYATGCGSAGGFFDNARRWAFIYGVDTPVGGAGTAFGPMYFASYGSAHPHELGHTAHLQHEGPLGTAAGYAFGLGFSGEAWAEGNYRPTYPSRMNYRNVFYGGGNGNSGAAYSAAGFSAGPFIRALSLNALPETCPFGSSLGPTSPTMLLLANPRAGSTLDDIPISPGAGACAAGTNVDWNADGSISTGSTHSWVSERYAAERRRFVNRAPNATYGYGLGPNAAVIVNNVLLVANTSCVGGACTGALYGESTADCSPYPTLPDSVGFNIADGAYPACLRHGTSSVPHSPTQNVIDGAIALAGYRADGGTGTPDQVFEAYTSTLGATIWTNRFGVSPASASVDPREFTGGPAAPFNSLGVTTVSSGPRANLGLIRVPGTNTLLLVYVAASGEMRQLAINPVTGTSTSSFPSTDIAAVQLANPNSSGGLAVIDGRVWMVRLSSSNGVQLYRLDTTGAVETRRWELILTRASLPGGQPALLVAPDYETPAWSRVFVIGRDNVGILRVDQSPVTSAGAWWTGTWRVRQSFLVNDFPEGPDVGSVSAVWDSRTTLTPGAAGLRVYRILRTAGGVPGAPALEIDPFGNGADASVTTDYNDWDGIQFGFCHTLEGLAGYAPTATTPYNPTSYVDFVRCGDLPNFLEPTPTGLVNTVRGNGHRALFPYLY